jgi:sugar O-acyltransferase (sialic acid O-acetyltransferase NeuD family)
MVKRAMAKKVVFLGAGGFGGFARDLCEFAGREPYGFLDSYKPKGLLVNGCPVLGPINLVDEPNLHRECEFIITVQDFALRRNWARRIEAAGGTLTRLFHPSVVISPSAAIGKGVMINAFSFVYANAVVGDLSIIESHCNIGTEVTVGEVCMVAPGVHLNRGASVGERTFLGSCSVSRPLVKIGQGCLIGAGAVVVKDIPDFKVAAGVPAEILRDNVIPA